MDQPRSSQETDHHTLRFSRLGFSEGQGGCSSNCRRQLPWLELCQKLANSSDQLCGIAWDLVSCRRTLRVEPSSLCFTKFPGNQSRLYSVNSFLGVIRTCEVEEGTLCIWDLNIFYFILILGGHKYF